jgi:hypothetical protein
MPSARVSDPGTSKGHLILVTYGCVAEIRTYFREGVGRSDGDHRYDERMEPHLNQSGVLAGKLLEASPAAEFCR